MAASIQARVKEIVCEQLGVSEDEVTPQADLEQETPETPIEEADANQPEVNEQNVQNPEPEQQANVVEIDVQAILEEHLQDSGELHRGVQYDFEYEEDEQERRFL